MIAVLPGAAMFTGASLELMAVGFMVFAGVQP